MCDKGKANKESRIDRKIPTYYIMTKDDKKKLGFATPTASTRFSLFNSDQKPFSQLPIASKACSSNALHVIDTIASIKSLSKHDK
jgi:hypothetical protein